MEQRSDLSIPEPRRKIIGCRRGEDALTHSTLLKLMDYRQDTIHGC